MRISDLRWLTPLLEAVVVIVVIAVVLGFAYLGFTIEGTKK